MATLTIDDFTALSNCSIDNGVVPGLFNFNTDSTGTGLDDWALTGVVAGDTVDVSTFPGSLYIAATGASGAHLVGIKKSDAINGDFEAEYRLTAHLTTEGSGVNFIYYDEANTNYVYVSVLHKNGVYRIDFNNQDSLVDRYEQATPLPLPLRIILKRVVNTFTCSYSLDDGSNYVSLTSTAKVISTTGEIHVTNFTKAGVATSARFDWVRFNSGLAVDAEAQIHDAGIDIFDAGVGGKFDMSTAVDNATGSMTVDRRFDRFNNPADVPSYSADVSLATYRLTADSNDRYQAQQIIISGAGAGAVFDSFEIESIGMDVTPPTDVSATTSRTTGSGEAFRTVIAWTNGTDLGSLYKGATVELEVDSVWYIFKSNWTWEETTETDPQEYMYIGTGGSKEGILVDSEEGPDGFETATRSRITSYDNALNTSSITLNIVTDDIPDPIYVLTSTTTDNEQGRFDVINLSNDVIKSGVTWGIDGGETGTLISGGGSSSMIISISSTGVPFVCNG